MDGYEGHRGVLIDEMDGNRCSPTFLNQLCDRYRFTVPQHCAPNVEFVAEWIVIVSNYYFFYWWKSGASIAPFMRRISWSMFFGNKKKRFY